MSDTTPGYVPGEVVVLNSDRGGPKMTVTEVYANGDIEVVWVALGGRLEKASFPDVCVTPVKEENL